MTIGEKVVASLRKRDGYDGDGSLESVKTFIKEKGLDLEIDGFDSIDAAFAASDKPAAKRVIVPDNDEGDTDDSAAEPAKPAKKQARNPHTIPSVSAETHKAHAERKAYERKAARGQVSIKDPDAAELLGSWFMTTFHPRSATKSMADLVAKANVSTTFTSGGALVPGELSPEIINLKEEYGVVRQLVGTTPMARDTISVPRRTGGLTVYRPGEAVAITESNPAFDQVTLRADQYAVLTGISNVLENDSILALGNYVAEEIAYAFASDEDNKLINGDGTSTYHHVTGIPYKFRLVLEAGGGTWTTDADKAKLATAVTAASKTWTSIVMADFEKLAGILPAYVKNPAWVCHKKFYWEVMQRLMLAQGGVTYTETAQGQRVPSFLGFPVVVSQWMPAASGTGDQVVAMLGEYGRGAKFGEVNGSMEIASSQERYFDQAVTAYRGLHRVAFAVHDVGNYHATASSRVPGPIGALITPN